MTSANAILLVFSVWIIEGGGVSIYTSSRRGQFCFWTMSRVGLHARGETRANTR